MRIERVIDGDTVVLSDKERLRLIGIDTPEIGRDGAASMPGAERARDALSGMIGSGTAPLHIRHDRERRDAHGRMLAHLFLADGGNVQARLLEDGLAVPLTIPPNLGFVACYAKASADAQSARRGLWSLPAYQPLPVEALDHRTRGYRVVRGTVTRIGRSRTSLWINLGPRFALRVVAGDLAWFRDAGLDTLEGAEIEARGVIYSRSAQLRMRIRHPVDLIQRKPVEPAPLPSGQKEEATP